MSCSPFDLKDYFLQELPAPEQRQVEAHVRGCPPCREELDRLRLTEAALFSLRDEEVPQRIAFVSDKIFEPSPWARAWAAFWGSGARLVFASAAMLSVALVVFSLSRPAPAPGLLATPHAPAAVPADLDQRIQAAVTQAVAASEARQEKKMEQKVAEARQWVAWAEADRDISHRHELVTLRSSYEMPQAQNGAGK